jgi:hypothetical protein
MKSDMSMKFQQGKIDILVGVLSAMGTGLTLTRASFVILFDQAGDPGIYKQAPARMHRQGNYNWSGVHVYELFYRGIAIEESVKARREGRQHWAQMTEIQATDEVASDANQADIDGDERSDSSDSEESDGDEDDMEIE